MWVARRFPGAVAPGWHDGAPLVLGNWAAFGSIPNVGFIIFDPVFFQEHPEFLLKRFAPMMFPLPVNVSFQRRQVGRADGKAGVTPLPGKSGQRRGLGFHPFGGTNFQLLHQIRNGHRARQANGQMDMIRHPAGAITFAIRIAGHGGEIGVQLRPGAVVEPRLAVFGAENEVNNDEA